jgi:site-specific recombinase XerD
MKTALASDLPAPGERPGSETQVDWPVNRECRRQFEAWLLRQGYAPRSGAEVYRAAAHLALEELTQPYWSVDPGEIVRQARARLERRADLRTSTRQAYRMALHKVHEFLLFQRNLPSMGPDPLALPDAFEQVPEWLAEVLQRYLRLQQRRWPERVVRERTFHAFWLLWGVGTYFIEHYHWSDWSQLARPWVDAYVEAGLRRGLVSSTINDRLIAWQTFCRFALEEGRAVPAALTQLRLLDRPRSLPRPLSDHHVHQLEQEFHAAIQVARSDYARRQARLDRAWFYLMWHCGLRLSEVRYLTVGDLDLEGRKLFIRSGKGRKDRVVYLSDTTVTALRAHLSARPEPEAGYVFSIHGHVPMRATVEHRLASYGQRAHISVTPHRLRHTFASQLLAAGMPVTSLQRYLGHEKLDTTMIYAEVSDPQLEQDYYRGIVSVDPPSGRLLRSTTEKTHQARLRRLVRQLQQPKVTAARRQAILAEMQQVLAGPRKERRKRA